MRAFCAVSHLQVSDKCIKIHDILKQLTADLKKEPCFGTKTSVHYARTYPGSPEHASLSSCYYYILHYYDAGCNSPRWFPDVALYFPQVSPIFRNAAWLPLEIESAPLDTAPRINDPKYRCVLYPRSKSSTIMCSEWRESSLRCPCFRVGDRWNNL